MAYLTRAQGFDAGVVISASHNPFDDNGIKVFSGGGEKFTEKVERQVEAIVADLSWDPSPTVPSRVGSADLVGAYVDHLRGVFPEAGKSRGLLLGVDCANGATTPVARQLFSGLGFNPVVIPDQPAGRNINLDCGSTHPEALARLVVERACHAGVAFDVDGYRAIFIYDHRGRVVDGDAVMLMCGRQLQREGRLVGAPSWRR